MYLQEYFELKVHSLEFISRLSTLFDVFSILLLAKSVILKRICRSGLKLDLYICNRLIVDIGPEAMEKQLCKRQKSFKKLAVRAHSRLEFCNTY